MVAWQRALKLNWLDTRQVHSSPVGLHTADLAHWTTSFVHQHIRSFSDRQDRVCTKRPPDVRTEPATGKVEVAHEDASQLAQARLGQSSLCCACLPQPFVYFASWEVYISLHTALCSGGPLSYTLVSFSLSWVA